MGRLDSAIERSQRALFALQHPEGYWQGALEANAEMNAEYIIFNRFMELERDLELEAKLKKHAARNRSRPTAAGRSFPAARATSRPASKATSP